MEDGEDGDSFELSLIIDGKTLIHALHESIRKDFIRLCTQCSSVICCRVSPIQKAEMVELVQEHTKVGCPKNEDSSQTQKFRSSTTKSWTIR